MFKRSARYLLLVGLYVLTSVFLYLDSLSAFYLQDEEPVSYTHLTLPTKA